MTVRSRPLTSATGKARWQWKGDGPAYASPVVATIGGVRHVITQTQKSIVSVNAATGALLWQAPFTTAYEQNSVTPVVRGDLVIYSGLENGVTAVRIARQGNPVGRRPGLEERPGRDVHELAGDRRHDAIRPVASQPRAVLRAGPGDRQDLVDDEGTRRRERLADCRRPGPAALDHQRRSHRCAAEPREVR